MDDDGDDDNDDVAPTVQLAPSASPPASAVPSRLLPSSSAHRSQEIKTPTELVASGPELRTTPGEMEHQAASQHPPMLDPQRQGIKRGELVSVVAIASSLSHV